MTGWSIFLNHNKINGKEAKGLCSSKEGAIFKIYIYKVGK